MPLLLLYRAPSFRSLCTEGCARTIRSTCNVIRESAATLQHVLFAQVQTLFLAHKYCIHVCMYVHVRMYSTCECVYVHVHTYVRTYLGTRSIDCFTRKHILVQCIYVKYIIFKYVLLQIAAAIKTMPPSNACTYTEATLNYYTYSSHVPLYTKN